MAIYLKRFLWKPDCVNYRIECFVSKLSFQLSLKLTSPAMWSLFRGLRSKGRLLALLPNIRLVRKKHTGKNTSACFAAASVTDKRTLDWICSGLQPRHSGSGDGEVFGSEQATNFKSDFSSFFFGGGDRRKSSKAI